MPSVNLFVRLEDITPEGLQLPLTLSADELAPLLALPGEEPLVLCSPLCGNVSLYRLDGAVRLKGQFEVTVENVCDRCLAESQMVLVASFNEVLKLAPSGQAEVEKPTTVDSFGGDASGGEDDDACDAALAVKGGQVSLAECLVEQFWVAWPYRYFCRAECLGLCQRCGANLNDGACSCSH